MDSVEFERTKQYVGFDRSSSAALAAFHPLARPHLPRIVDDFYTAIEAHADARRVITGGAEQIARLKRTLTAWLENVLLGPHDDEFLRAHSRIGAVHVRIGLPQQYMFAAMDRIRLRLFEVALEAHAGDASRLRQSVTAVNQILDLELAIMLDSYREHLARKIRTGERLATIGQLAASIGHELRNPLGIIESSLFLLRQRLEKLGVADAQVDKHHDKIVRQVKHCGQTITNLLDLARDKPAARRAGPLLPIVETAIEQAALPAQMTIALSIPEELAIDADPEDLAHVIANLLANAADAEQGRGHVTIEGTRGVGGTLLFVEDRGPGVPVEIRERIFDALFTTKARGTGLGLALCRRIVDAHAGELSLEPSERGARFRVFIPDTERAIGPERGA
jgi:signal transduction histidine kinase